MPLQLAVVIVNYRTAALTIGCLESLARELRSFPDLQVFVVENGSGDGSAPQIAEAIEANRWSDWVRLLPQERNGGFSFGNNVALRLLLQAPDKPPYVLLLNPDTIVRPGAILALVDFMGQHPEAGIVGSRLEDPDGTPQNSAFRFHTLITELDSQLRLGIFSRLIARWSKTPGFSDSAHRTDWVAGASMLVRTAVFDSIGMFDEGYFLYFEEVDLCLRAVRTGWTCWYEPRSRVVHLVGQSTGVTNPKSIGKRLPTYWFDSRRRYFVKNYGRLYAVIVDLAWLGGQLLWQLRRRIQGKPDSTPAAWLRDQAHNSVFAKGFRL
jgi:GT2 family glycosyltransferase